MFFFLFCLAISEGHGDAALELLKAGAETDKRDVDGHLAIDLAPDSKVSKIFFLKKKRFISWNLWKPTKIFSSFLSLKIYIYIYIGSEIHPKSG